MGGQIWRVEIADGGPDAWRFLNDKRFPSRAEAEDWLHARFAGAHDRQGRGVDPKSYRVVQVPE